MMNLTVSERTLEAVAAGLVVLILLLLALVVYPSSPPNTNTSSSSAAADQPLFVRGEQVLSLVGQFSNALGNRSVQALADLYSSTSTARWYGNAQALTNGGTDLAGTYSGRGNISGLYASFIGRTSSPWVERMSNATIQVGSDSVNSTSDVSLFGIDQSGSVFNSTVGIQQEWVQDAGGPGWHIQTETWNFLNFTSLSLPGSPWVAGESYPENVQGQSCTTVADETYDSGEGVIVVPNVLGGDYVFCVGGSLKGQAGASMSYFAEVPLSSGADLGPWTATTPYPEAGASPSCVAYVQAIFCVGGGPASSPTSAVYAAPISPHGLGAWENVGPYPLEVSDTSCVLRPTDQDGNPYMVCVGGREANGTDTDAVYGAVLVPGSAEIPTEISAGPWTPLFPPYPTPVEGASCVYYYAIYCVGGMANGSLLREVFTAGAIVNGEGSWSQYASYPARTSGESCAVGGLKGSIYCVGGTGASGGWTAVYYTNRVSGAWSSAVWVPARPYPGQLFGGSCFFGNDTITLYCIAGSQVEYYKVLENNSSP
jgi:hypothetical protein